MKRVLFASGFATLFELADCIEMWQPCDDITVVWDKFFTSNEFDSLFALMREADEYLAA